MDRLRFVTGTAATGDTQGNGRLVKLQYEQVKLRCERYAQSGRKDPSRFEPGNQMTGVATCTLSIHSYSVHFAYFVYNRKQRNFKRKGGSTPPRSLRSGETGAGFDSQ